MLFSVRLTRLVGCAPVYVLVIVLFRHMVKGTLEQRSKKRATLDPSSVCLCDHPPIRYSYMKILPPVIVAVVCWASPGPFTGLVFVRAALPSSIATLYSAWLAESLYTRLTHAASSSCHIFPLFADLGCSWVAWCRVGLYSFSYLLHSCVSVVLLDPLR